MNMQFVQPEYHLTTRACLYRRLDEACPDHAQDIFAMDDAVQNSIVQLYWMVSSSIQIQAKALINDVL